MVHKSFDQRKKSALAAEHPASLHTLIKWTSGRIHLIATFDLVAFYLVQAGHAPGASQLGSAYLEYQQATERSAGAVLSRAPWTIKVVAQERG